MQIQDVDPSLTGLLQIAAMLLLPATLGLSVTRSLRVAPSHFLNRSLETYFPALIGFDLLWLGGAALWLAFGASPVAELDAVVDGRNLRLAVAILLGLVSVGQVTSSWTSGPARRRPRDFVAPTFITCAYSNTAETLQC